MTKRPTGYKIEQMNSETSFGDWVRRRRKALDLTQEKLADLIGCSHSAIRKFETDERRPSLQVAELLAKHLKIDEDQRTRFLDVARGIVSVDKLPASSSTPEPASTPQAFIPPTNIPATSTPFIGREQDIASLTKLIQDPHCRLITVLGQGGIGKTRLALHLAEESLDVFDGRVYFVPLAPLNNPESILPAIAAIFGLTALNTDLKTLLVGYLREKHILLVLDNFEHLIQGADQFAQLLTQAPQLKLLVTSRERLNLQGEWTFELSGLSVPPETQSTVGAYDALELFEQCVKRARPEFQFAESDRGAAIRICNLIEGLPLAIELAAAWIQVLSINEIAREIEKSFDFLKTSQRNMPERHKSLRAVFDHSWQLLSDEERLALSRLSIFHGGFSREAAQVIAGASFETLSNLLAKSLIRRAENGRFDMHEAIRQYSAQYVENEQMVRASYARYYLAIMSSLEKSIQTASGSGDIQSLTHEFANVHAALHWGVENKMYAELHGVFLPLWGMYDIRGRTRDGFLIIEKLVAALRAEPVTSETQAWLARVLTYYAMFCYRLGDFHKGRVVIDEVLAMVRPLNNPQSLIEPLLYSGIIYGLTGNVVQALQNVEEGVALAKEFNIEWFVAAGTFNKGALARLQGDLQRASGFLKEALALWQGWRTRSEFSGLAQNYLRLTGLALNYLSAIAIELDVRDEARTYLEESLKLASTNTDRWGIGAAWRGLGALALREGDASMAESYVQQSIAIFTELGTRGDLAESVTLLGKLHLYKSEFEEAQNALKKALRLGLESNTMPQVYEASVEFADCLLNLNRVDDAVAILGAFPESAVRVESVRWRVEQVRGEVEAQYPSARENVSSQSLEGILSSLLKE